jgi:hypothetical protein
MLLTSERQSEKDVSMRLKSSSSTQSASSFAFAESSAGSTRQEVSRMSIVMANNIAPIKGSLLDISV